MDKRSTVRTSMSLDFSTRLVLDGETYTGVPVTNLGLNGCCVKLPAAATPHLHPGARLERVELAGASAGPYTLRARIVWHDAPRFGGGKWVNAGLEFLETPADCVRELRERVAESLAYREP